MPRRRMTNLHARCGGAVDRACYGVMATTNAMRRAVKFIGNWPPSRNEYGKIVFNDAHILLYEYVCDCPSAALLGCGTKLMASCHSDNCCHLVNFE